MVICVCVSCRIPVVLITAGRSGGTSSYDCYVSMVQICLASKHKDSQQWQNDSLVSRSWFGCVHCAKTEGGGLGRANTNQDPHTIYLWNNLPDSVVHSSSLIKHL